MKNLRLALTVLVLAFIGYSSSLELFSLDCEGGMQILPSFPVAMQFDYSLVTGVAETFLSIYKDRLKCMCSELTDDEFNRLFHPFFGADMLFNIIRGPDADLSLSKCNWSDFEHVAFRVQQFNNLAINLTDTCTHETWKNDNKCLLQSQTFSDWDVTVKAGLFRCPKAPWRPAISVVCEGMGCDQAFIPCMSDNDCAGDMTCQKFMFDNVVRPSVDDIVSAFRTMLIADDTPASCINSGNFIMKAVDIVRKLWKKDSADYTLPEIQFCSPIPLNYFTNSTFDWAGFLHYSNTSFVTGNNSINMPGYFQPWNGELLGGGKMVPPQKVYVPPPVIGPITPGATLAFKKSCDGTLSFLPTAGFGVQLNIGWTQGFLNHWVSTVMDILKCRFNNLGVSISDQELIDRWALGLDNIFFVTDAATRYNPIVRPDLRDYRMDFPTRLNYPSSCNYDTWVNQGSCYASYTGLANLLGADVTANLELLKCPGTPDVSIAVECVGEACSLLSLKTKPCNTDADCPDSLSCKDLNVEMGDFDWLGRYIGLWNTNNATNQCTLNGNEIHSVTRRLLLTYFGIEYDGSSDNKYCMIDYDHVRSQVSTWVNGEVETTSPGVVTLKNLKSWNEEGKVPSSSLSLTSTLSFLLLIGTFVFSALF
jgi:hypothetical protein